MKRLIGKRYILTRYQWKLGVHVARARDAESLERWPVSKTSFDRGNTLYSNLKGAMGELAFCSFMGIPFEYDGVSRFMEDDRGDTAIGDVPVDVKAVCNGDLFKGFPVWKVDLHPDWVYSIVSARISNGQCLKLLEDYVPGLLLFKFHGFMHGSEIRKKKPQNVGVTDTPSYCVDFDELREWDEITGLCKESNGEQDTARPREGAAV